MSDRIDLPLWVYFSLASMKNRQQAICWFRFFAVVFPFSLYASWVLHLWLWSVLILCLCSVLGAAIYWVDKNSSWY